MQLYVQRITFNKTYIFSVGIRRMALTNQVCLQLLKMAKYTLHLLCLTPVSSIINYGV